MARRLGDPCIFCGENPCACTAPKARAVRPKAIARPTAPAVAIPVVARAPRAARFSEDDIIEITALQNLSDLMHPEELERLEGKIQVQFSPAERALAWKLMK